MARTIKIKIPARDETEEITARSRVLEESKTEVSRKRKLNHEAKPIPTEAINILKKWIKVWLQPVPSMR